MTPDEIPPKTFPTRFPKRNAALLVLLLLLTAALFLPGLGSSNIHREQELRVVLTARDMAEGGSWLIPHYRGQPRLKKPPLMYWAVASAFLLAGDTHSLFAARLPSVAAGVGMVIAVYVFGCLLIGRRRALLASLLVPTTFILLRQTRVAETDVALALFVTIAVCSGFAAMTRQPAWRWWLLAGVAGGLGFMTKGPAAAVLPPLAWIAYTVSQPSARRRLLSKATLPGLAAFLVIALPWYIFVTFFGTAGEDAQSQIGKEIMVLTTESHHAGPIYYYLYTLFHALAPWSLLLPPALVLSGLRGWRHRGVRFASLWFLSSFAALSLISSKQIHYTTLLVAPSLLLIGWFAGTASTRRASVRGRFSTGFVRGLSILGCIAGLAIFLAPFAQPAWPAGVCRLAGAAVFFIALAGGDPKRTIQARILAFSFALSVIIALYTVRLEPIYEKHVVLSDLLARNSALLRKAPRVFASGAEDSILDFYSPVPVTHRENPDRAWRDARAGDVVLVVTDPRSALPSDWKSRKPLDSSAREDIGIFLYLRGVSTIP